MYQGKFAPIGQTEKPQQTAVKPAALPKKQKRQPSLGSTVFYTLYFLFIILFCAGTLYATNRLDAWLMDFEASQPSVKADAVFHQLFDDPKWEDLYVSAGIPNSRYENAKTYTDYMQARATDQSLTYTESSGGGSGEKTYDILLGAEKIASFTMKDHNTSTKIAAIADWQLGEVALFLNRDLSYRIVTLNGHTAKVNGVTLQDSDILQITTTVAEKYLPSGVTVPRVCTLAVEGLFALPEVEILDKDGNPVEVSYDADTCTFAESTVVPEIPEDLKQVALDASEYHALWMAAEVNDETTLKTYFLAGTDTYKSILPVATDNPAQDSTREFTKEAVTDYVRYDESHFSVRVEMNLTVTQTTGEVKDWPYGRSMIFQKQSSGKWLCVFSGDADLSKPVGRVRLTFIQENIPVYSDFFYTDAKEIITPVINTPEGKVFAGWVRRDTDENGTETQELVYRPDSTGRVAVPEGRALTPMTLYAHFESLGGN